mmetsp:Transcript_14011/g.16150  ORF Transcript_14011/g.16150 Transcript_14011/m.16150 type:complete len:312 (+) Transcript_14011:26-961(+)
MKVNISILAVLALVILTPAVIAYEYNETLAIELVDAAGSTYCPQEHQLALTCGPSCDNMAKNGYRTLYAEKYDNHALSSEAFSIFYKPDTNHVIISFRGTAANFQMFEEFVRQHGVPYTLHGNEFEDIRIMEYIYTHYVSQLRNKLLVRIAKIKREFTTASYIFTGHSLGGAYATLATYDFANNGLLDKTKIQCYSFGSPRVGNYEFAEAMKNTGVSNFRIVNSIDFAPHCPSCNKNLITGECLTIDVLLTTWSPYHVDNEIYYEDFSMEKGKYKICSDESLDCSYGVPGLNLDVESHLWYFGKRIGCSGF